MLTERCLFPPRDEWEWLQSLSGPVEVEGADQATDCLLFSELQMAIKSLLHHINLPLHQVLQSTGQLCGNLVLNTTIIKKVKFVNIFLF